MNFNNPDGRKAFAPEPVEDNVPRGGLLDFYSRGGYESYASYNEFLGNGMPFFYKGSGSDGGGGGENGVNADNSDDVVSAYYEALSFLGVKQNSGEYFKDIDFSGYGDTDPHDIIIRNRKGHIMYRILSKTVYKDVKIDTDIEIGNPMTVNLEDYEKMGAHAVGFSLDYSATLGGGPNGGLAFVYFMAGGDAGSGYVYGYTGGNTGFEASIGVSKFYAKFVDKELKDNFNAAGYAGKSSGHGFGVGVWGYSKSWGNRTNDGELWPGQKSKTTWVTISNGAAYGEMGGKVFWSNYKILKKVF